MNNRNPPVLAAAPTSDGLRRTLTLPLLVFYGLGVTVGAGIFALVGEILGIAGDHAPLSFLAAGIVAGVTGLSYTQLIRLYPRAGGEAVFAHEGLGPVPGRVAGLGVVTTGIVSSAVIALAFAGYVRSLVAVPDRLIVIAVVVGLAWLAMKGIRESVIFAAVITVVEVGTLLVIIGFGLPLLGDGAAVVDALTPTAGDVGLNAIFAGAVVAFFAFVGFEDIANMAEETVDPGRTAARAIVITLGVTLVIYVVLATMAAMVPNRGAITESDAPLSALFEEVSGLDGRAVSVIAVVAMINGILVQIVMASRVLYGMAQERLLPDWFAHIDDQRRTPVRATGFVAVAIMILAVAFPLVGLAQATSLITLVVFSLVNLSLFVLGGRAPETIGRKRWIGAFGFVLTVSMAAWHVGSEVLSIA